MSSHKPLQYTLIRTQRKTTILRINAQGLVEVRAPKHLPKDTLDTWVRSKTAWIQKHTSFTKPIYSTQVRKKMQQELQHYLSERVYALWKSSGLPPYTSIRVTRAEYRWGSCSARNALCFSYRLAEFLPHQETHPHLSHEIRIQIIDAIIVHELAHLQEKNHQTPFWNLVIRLMPSYHEAIAYLRKAHQSPDEHYSK